MRRSLAVAAVASAFVLALGCRSQSIEPRSRFVEEGVGVDAPVEWGGESIEIENAGVTTTGGVEISSDPEVTRVGAVARMLAIADTEDKANADRAIDEAKKAFKDLLESSGGKAVRCGHGGTFGSAQSIDSGCEVLDVSLPVGNAMKPLSVTARSGLGNVLVTLDPATFLGSFDLRVTNGSIDFQTPANAGASITIVAETGGDVVLRLPRDFAADAIVLETTPDKIETIDFPDVSTGKGRGEAGRGAKLITVRGGKIRLVRQ